METMPSTPTSLPLSLEHKLLLEEEKQRKRTKSKVRYKFALESLMQEADTLRNENESIKQIFYETFTPQVAEEIILGCLGFGACPKVKEEIPVSINSDNDENNNNINNNNFPIVDIPQKDILKTLMHTLDIVNDDDDNCSLDTEQLKWF